MKTKTTLSRILAALALGGVMLPPLQAGNDILLYPLARAFGSPPESELAKCRQAFQQMQSHLGESRVAVQPVLCIGRNGGTWRRKLAVDLAREAELHTTAELTVPRTGAPAVEPTELGHNQLRYLWKRATVYSNWVKADHPAVDYIWIAEIWGHDGKVGAIHFFVLDARGQIAYCRLYNSHQFGPNLPLKGDAAVRLFVRRFFEDLMETPEKVFPPYGVG